MIYSKNKEIEMKKMKIKYKLQLNFCKKKRKKAYKLQLVNDAQFYKKKDVASLSHGWIEWSG